MQATRKIYKTIFIAKFLLLNSFSLAFLDLLPLRMQPAWYLGITLFCAAFFFWFS